MGKLLALELFNFKSYKGHHVLQFGDSYFTSIIGPNGSGKSNSMDAISFVLGIKSSHLRSTHLKDLVYRGRVLKNAKIDINGDVAENGEANGLTEEDDAQTQRSTQRNDPQTAWVMAVYEDDAGDEQRWKRSITSSGASEYRINNRVVTAKQYNDALEAENILIKARNFLVFQGDVEAIASQSPKDLTRLIEQISGSLDYKNEYERLKVDKEKADEEQSDKLNRRRAINGEIQQFQKQKEELDRFEDLRKDQHHAIITNVLWKLFHFQRTIEDSTVEVQKHQEELKEYRRNVDKFEARLEAAKREQAKVGREIAKYERDIRSKEKELGEKKSELVPIDEKLDLTKKRVTDLEKRKATVASEQGRQLDLLNSTKKQLGVVQKAQKRWEDEWRAQQQQAGRELDDADLKEYQLLRGEVYKRSGSEQVRVDNISRQLKTDEETVNSLKSRVDSTRSQVEGLQFEIEALTQNSGSVSADIKATGNEIDAKKTALNAVESDRQRTYLRRTELEEKLQQVLRKYSEATRQQRDTHKEIQQKETVAAMKRIFPGVKGMVHQLCQPKQKKYETAVATVLGRHWDAVVVDSEKTAKDCISYLKEQRAGQATFIPLDTIIHKQPNANLRGLHKGMRLAIDTIEFDANVERAFSYACGNAIVTDTLDIARELCYHRGVDAKAVALNGTVIHKGGNMTGGESPNERKRRFDDAEVENLRTLIEKFKTDLQNLPNDHKKQTENENLQSELNRLQQKRAYLQEELKALQRNIESKTKELNHAKVQLTEVEPKHEEQARGLDMLRQSLSQHRDAIAELEDELFEGFCRRLNFNNIREYEALQGSMQQEAQAKKLQFSQQIKRLQNQVEFQAGQLEDTKRRIAKLTSDSERDQRSIEHLEEAKEALASEVDMAEAEIEQVKESLDSIKEDQDSKAQVVNVARKEVQIRQKDVQKTLEKIRIEEDKIKKADFARYDVLRMCKVENIKIPLEDASRSIDTLPLEDAALADEDVEDDEDAMEVDGQADASLKVKDYGIHVDFSDLEEELQEDDSEDCAARLEAKIASMQADLDKMAPNMRSADRLEQTSERLVATEQDFNNARSSARKATKAFEAVQKKRSDLFNKAFAHISEQIKPVYRDLTRTAAWPLGGQAYLDTEDETEPYLAGVKYHVTPPAKRFRDMEHLSGGEKTMAALALLFAVHTYAPSPFFVLDEVDAALDHANTTQLASYVRDKAGPGMQFVVISLKTGLFQNSETLVGVMRDQAVNSSRTLTLDLRKYQAV